MNLYITGPNISKEYQEIYKIFKETNYLTIYSKYLSNTSDEPLKQTEHSIFNIDKICECDILIAIINEPQDSINTYSELFFELAIAISKNKRIFLICTQDLLGNDKKTLPGLPSNIYFWHPDIIRFSNILEIVTLIQEELRQKSILNCL